MKKPASYTFNTEGWVETRTPYPKFTVSFLPYLFSKLGGYELLLQNLLALRLLNNRPHEELEAALRNRYKQANMGRAVDDDIMDKVIEKSRAITDTSALPPICDDILQFDTIWFAYDCSAGGRSQIKSIIRNNYIGAIRSMMPVDSKYKTKDVMKEADVSKYSVNSYWKSNKLDARGRTLSAIIEAVEEASDCGVNPTQEVIAKIAGVSVKSIQRYKEMWMLNK